MYAQSIKHISPSIINLTHPYIYRSRKDSFVIFNTRSTVQHIQGKIDRIDVVTKWYRLFTTGIVAPNTYSFAFKLVYPDLQSLSSTPPRPIPETTDCFSRSATICFVVGHVTSGDRWRLEGAVGGLSCAFTCVNISSDVLHALEYSHVTFVSAVGHCRHRSHSRIYFRYCIKVSNVK